MAANSVNVFIFLMKAQCVFVKWEMKSYTIRSQENEMSGTGSTYGAKERCIEGLGY